jgi:hypothetical protein
MEDKKDSSPYKPQLEVVKEAPIGAKGRERKLIATKTCIVQLPDCDCEKQLVEGEPVTGLKPQEREHLLFHGFVI